MLQVKLKVHIKVNTCGHDNQHIIDKGMGRGDHQTLQEIETKCGTSGVIAISYIWTDLN
jgi:hypothetical protein